MLKFTDEANPNAGKCCQLFLRQFLLFAFLSYQKTDLGSIHRNDPNHPLRDDYSALCVFLIIFIPIGIIYPHMDHQKPNKSRSG